MRVKWLALCLLLAEINSMLTMMEPQDEPLGASLMLTMILMRPLLLPWRGPTEIFWTVANAVVMFPDCQRSCGAVAVSISRNLQRRKDTCTSPTSVNVTRHGHGNQKMSSKHDSPIGWQSKITLITISKNPCCQIKMIRSWTMWTMTNP